MTDTLPKTNDIRKSDRLIPWMVVAFFAVFISVDAVMATLAIRTQTGLVTEQAYEKGLAYNHTLEAAETQQQWGWTSHIEVMNNAVFVRLQDKDGQVIKKAGVAADVIRPIKSGHDFKITLHELPDGRYTAPLTFPLPGEWKIRIYAQSDGKTYQASQIIMAP